MVINMENNDTYLIDRLKKEPLDEKTADRLAEVFKVFGDNTRIKLLWLLLDKEICVYDIADALDMTQSAISHQLRTLKQARLVKARRDGKNTFYSLDDDHVKGILEQVLTHIKEQ